jgi:hypothetical protein
MTELDDEAGRLLELTRQARTPSTADKARVEQLLGSVLLTGAAGAHAASASAAASKTVGSGLATKWIGIALFALAGGGGYLAWHAGHAPRMEPASAATAAKAAPHQEPPSIGDLAEPVQARRDQSEATQPERHAVAPSASSSNRSKDARETLAEELDLLHAAQAKWRGGDASAALALLSEHRRRFPSSQLASERDALTVLSLCATHREAEAKKLARRFLQTAQHSPLRTSVEESCGGK